MDNYSPTVAEVLQQLKESLQQLAESQDRYLKAAEKRDERLVAIAEEQLKMARHYYAADLANLNLREMDLNEIARHLGKRP